MCDRVATIVPGNDAAARALFADLLRPVAVSNRGDREGLFTGYYEPTLRGSRVEGGDFTVPLYVRPPELVSVDLGRFRADLKGKRIAGKVADGALVPYLDRTAIDEGALAGRELELVWVDDPVDAFFLEIQGSGRIQLEDGSEMRVGYAGQNGFVYTAIGRELIRRGALTREQMSMETIREWLAANPDEAREVMRTNASYVFFRELTGDGPVGSLGVALTPERSLAVDPLFVPLGVPVWIDTTIPAGALDRSAARVRCSACSSPRTPAAPSTAPCAATSSGATATTPRRRRAACGNRGGCGCCCRRRSTLPAAAHLARGARPTAAGLVSRDDGG